MAVKLIIVQDTGLLNKIRDVKAIVMEPRASDKENFDEVMRQFYDIIKNCHASGMLAWRFVWTVLHFSNMGSRPRYNNFLRIVIVVGIDDIITQSNFGLGIFRGLRSTGC